jgi:hypothetical protein
VTRERRSQSRGSQDVCAVEAAVGSRFAGAKPKRRVAMFHDEGSELVVQSGEGHTGASVERRANHVSRREVE